MTAVPIPAARGGVLVNVSVGLLADADEHPAVEPGANARPRAVDASIPVSALRSTRYPRVSSVCVPAWQAVA